MTKYSSRLALMTGLSLLALAACGSGGSTTAKSAAPMPPIDEMDTAMAQPAPQPLPLGKSDTLTPVLPSAAMPAPPSADNATTTTVTTVTGAPDPVMEARIARLEASVGALRSDYERIMPAFASLNTTNERIQTLLDEMEAEGYGEYLDQVEES